MKGQTWLLKSFFPLLLLAFLSSAGTVSAQPGTYADLGIYPGPDGLSYHWYSVPVPDDCYGAISTVQADGSLNTQYFKTKAQYEAALSALAKPSQQ